MKTTQVLSIPNPCPKKWAELRNEKNASRYCETCNKRVNNLSDKSDGEVIDFLSKNKGKKVCVKVRHDQLDRPLPPSYFTLRPKNWLLSSLVVLGLIPDAAALSTPSIQEEVNSVSQPQLQDSILISGSIIDSARNEGVMYAMVVVKNTNHGTTCDANGNFTLKIPAHWLEENILLEVRLIGYERKYVRVGSSTEFPLSIDLKPAVHFIGDLVIIKEPFYKRWFRKQ